MNLRSEARTISVNPRFDQLARLCQEQPFQDASWDELEAFGDEERVQAQVAECYRFALSHSDINGDYPHLARRALRYHEEWLGEDTLAVGEAFATVLRVDPSADWAFERLTLYLGNLQAWNELLEAYERRLTQVSAHDKRQVLLEEAAQVARDFADAPQRACGYLLELFRLSPHDTGLEATLERLIERHGTPGDFQQLWRIRIDTLDSASALPYRLKLAHDLSHRVGDLASAVEQLWMVLRMSPGHAAACDILAELLQRPGLTPAIRRDAMVLAREHLALAGREDVLLDVLNQQLGYLDDGDNALKASAHRELAQRYEQRNQPEKAMQQLFAAMRCDPNDATLRDSAEKLAQRHASWPQYVAALRESAAHATSASTRTTLRLEVVNHLIEQLAQPQLATEVLREIGLDNHAEINARLAAMHQLDQVLERLNDHEGRLSTLTQLAQLDPVPHSRRQTWIKQAELSLALGSIDRALTAWSQILLHDPNDSQAHEAKIAIFEANHRWEELAYALEFRGKTQASPEAARKDLLRAGQLREQQLQDPEQALRTYLSIDAASLDPEVVAAVDRVCTALARWETLAQWLEPLANRSDLQAARLIGRLAEVLAVHLHRTEEAAIHYARSLNLDPTASTVLDGAIKLVLQPQCVHKARLAEAVVAAFAALGDHGGELAAWAQFREVISDRGWQRKAALRSAELARLQGQPPGQVLDCWITAFSLDPQDLRAEQEILALVHESGRLQDIADLFGRCAHEQSHTPVRTAHLLATQAALLQSTQALEQAARAWLQAASHAPDRSDWLVNGLRNAMAGHNWQLTCEVMLTLEERGLPVERVLGDLESRVEQAGDWPGFLQALGDGLNHAGPSLPAQARGHWHLKVALWSRRERLDPQVIIHHARAAARLCDINERREALEVIEDALIVNGTYNPELLQISAELAASSHPSRGRALVLARAAVASGDRDRAFSALHDAIEMELARASHDEDGSNQSEMRWAVEQLLELLRRDKRTGPAYELLVRVAQRVQHGPQRAQWLAQAAELAIARDDHQAAMWSLAQAVRAAPTRRDLTDRLAALYRDHALWHELAALRQEELRHADELGLNLETLLSYRLQIVASVERLGDLQSRVDLLSANLAALPGHVETLRVLSDLLRRHGQQNKVVALLEEQAKALRERNTPGTRDQQAELWRLAGDCAQHDLRDTERAIAAYGQALSLHEDAATVTALAELCLQQRKHAQAAHWLERQLELAPPRERLSALYKLARAHASAGNWTRTAEVLHEAWPLRQGGHELARLYTEALEREAKWHQLLEVMNDLARDQTEVKLLIPLARRAFSLASDRLNAPRLALPLLERAIAGSDEGDLAQPYARALADAGHFDQAEAILRKLIEAFGRKRSPERAYLHVELAQVLRQRQDPAQALDELENAAAMDATRAAVLVQIAELAGPLGHYARAEKALRSLLWLVKKQEGESAANAPKAAWIQFRLAQLAKAQGNDTQAATLWDSCLESAARHDDQAQALQNLLREQGEFSRLLEVARVRLKNPLPTTKKAALWAEIAVVLANADDAEMIGQAMEAALSALTFDPALSHHHDLARNLSERAGAPERYRTLLRSLRERADDYDTAALLQLNLHLAQAIASEPDAITQDIRLAWDALEHARSLGMAAGEVARAGLQIATLLGDPVRQREHLDQLEALGLASNETRFESACALAQVHLSRPHATAEAVQALEAAAQEKPDWRQLVALLEKAHPDHLQQPAVLEFWEHAARESGEPSQILAVLLALSAHTYCPEDKIREAAELALQLDLPQRAQQLFQLALERAADPDSDAYLWARFGLYDLAMVAQDFAAAGDQLRAAANAGDPAPVIARALDFQAKVDAQGQGERALAVFERLFESDPYAQPVWNALVHAYVSQRNARKLEEVLERCLNGIESLSDRNRLRLSLVELLNDDPARANHVQDLLNDVLLEDPQDQRARQTLLDLCERRGDHDEFDRLLEESLSFARENDDTAGVVRDTLRLAGRLRQAGDSSRGLDLIQEAYALAPDNIDVRLALLDALPQTAADEEGEFAIVEQKAQILRSLVADGPKDRMATWALQASALAQELGEPDRATEVLNLALERSPSDQSLLRALGNLCTTAQAVHVYIERLASHARALNEPSQRAEIFAQAAQLAREKCHDYAQAARLIAEALADDPHNIGYWHVRIENLAQSQELPAAAQACEAALAALQGHLSPAGEAEFYAAAAEIAQVDDDLPATLRHLENAYARDTAYGDQLRERWSEALQLARNAQDLGGERTALLALVRLADQAVEPLLEPLGLYLERSVDDHEVAQIILNVAVKLDDAHHLRLAARSLLSHEDPATALHATEVYVQACEALGTLDEAQRAIDWQQERWPGQPQLRALYRRLVGARGDHLALAQLLLEDATTTGERSERVAMLRQAADLFTQGGAADHALTALLRAHQEEPSDVPAAVALVDACIDVERYDQAEAIADRCLAAFDHLKVKPAELSPMQHRKAWLRQARDDQAGLLHWLNEAYSTDKLNFDAALALADAAQAQSDWETASRVLRNLSTLDEEQCPISRVELFARQARLWQAAGDLRKASFWAHKAKHHAPNDPMALALLQELAAASKAQS